VARLRSAMSVMTFSNATVYTSRATSYGDYATQLDATKRLVLANIDWGGFFLKFYFKKVKK
jgi:hypothetical protein